MTNERSLTPLAAVARHLAISRAALTRLAKAGRFPLYENPLDRRQKLVDQAEVAAAVRPRWVGAGGVKGVAMREEGHDGR